MQIPRTILIFLLVSLHATSLCAQSRGLHKVTLAAKAATGENISLYRESHALLIGASRYTNGWPNLESIPGELNEVQQSLETKGFNVVRVDNPDSRQLKAAFDDFINAYGYSEGARLLFFYAGHGYSDKQGRGYIVPTDAPLPELGKEFKRKSLQMNQITAWARQIDSNHALFLFDSCFSGTIFKSRSRPAARFIQKATSQPVRQFITAGSAGEIVPAKSVFTPAFVKAITTAEGDLNNDGYVTGSELGLYLHQTVPQYVDQSPQYGKIRDYDLAQGDFVFFGVRPAKSNSKTSRDNRNPQRSNSHRNVETEFLTNITISDADRKLVWERLNNLKWAIENRNKNTIASLSSLDPASEKLLDQLFRKYKKIDLEVMQLSENPRSGSLYGHLRFKRFTRSDGSIAYPAKNIRDNRIVSRRTRNGWSSFQW